MVKCIIKNMKKYFLLAAMLYAAVLVSGSFNFGSNPDDSDSLFPLNIPKASISWNLSEYYSYSGPLIDAGFKYPRIFINDSSPSYNWSVWADAYPWLTGSGTWSDPYVIERLHIDGQGEGAGIFIYNSTSYFIIRGCYFENTGLNEFDIDIYIRYSINGQIYGNIFLNPLKGVYISHLSHNHSVYRNYMKGITYVHGRTTRAIQIAVGSHDNLISQNIAHEFGEFSHFSRSHNNTLEGNLMNNTVWEDYSGSPMVFSECNDTKVIGNILAGAFVNGRFELDEEDCSGNVFVGNVELSRGNVALPTPLSIMPSGLVINQDTVALFKLTSSHNNYIGNNILLVDGLEIPGYDLILVVGAVGVLSVVVLILNRKKWKQT